MSSVIKSDRIAELSIVRPLISLGAPPVVVSRQEEERDRLHQRIAALEVALRQRDSALAGQRLEMATAIEQATEEGRRAGLAEAEDRQEQRLALLQASLSRSEADISERFQSFERLAALLAHECLSAMLEDPEHQSDVLQKMIAVQTAKIEKSLLVSVELSRADYPDRESVARLARQLDLPETSVAVSDNIAPGGCTMVLKLGRLEVGIGQQWGVLRELLEQIALAEDGT